MSVEINNDDIFEVGDLIRQKREELNLTQLELADMAGLGEKSISRLETGGNMKLGTFFTLAGALGVTPDEISPKQFQLEVKDPAFAKIRSRYLMLSDKQKAMACDMMNSIIDHILKYS